MESLPARNKKGSFQDYPPNKNIKNGERIPKEGKEKTEIINNENYYQDFIKYN